MRRARSTMAMTMATAVLGMAALSACGSGQAGSDERGVITAEDAADGTAGPKATTKKSDSKGGSGAAADAAPGSNAAEGSNIAEDLNAAEESKAADGSKAATKPNADTGAKGKNLARRDAGVGCPPTTGSLPNDANLAETSVALDGDALGDTLWVGGGRKGVRTGSGGDFSQAISNVGGPKITIQAMSVDNVEIVMERGRLAYVSAVVDCQLVRTKNVRGGQYAFDLGYTTAGSNYGCFQTISGLPLLVGLGVREGQGARQWQVTRTVINLHDNGRSATNGAPRWSSPSSTSRTP